MKHDIMKAAAELGLKYAGFAPVVTIDNAIYDLDIFQDPDTGGYYDCFFDGERFVFTECCKEGGFVGKEEYKYSEFF